MSSPIHHADLVARALDALTPEDRARVDKALAQDEGLRAQFEAIAGHLLQYDHLPPAPPPPSFERLAAALDREAIHGGAAPDPGILRIQDARPRRPAAGTWRAVCAVAAVLLLSLVVWRPWQARPNGEVALVPGRGLTIARDGRPLPAPAHARRQLRAGDVLGCAAMAEAHLAGRVRVVLDAGSRLRVEAPSVVTLLAGRAWFEVQRRDGATDPAWVVRTEHGPVRVLGTVFEVDVRAGALEVGVAQGRVEAAGQAVAAGERLVAGQITSRRWAAGAWIDRPQLRLAAGPQTLGAPLTLRLDFENPGQVPVILRGPDSARTPLWISLEDAQGRILHELRAQRILAGGEILVPRVRTTLAPGARRSVTIEIAAPIASPGTYFCRALYRPEGQPGVLTDAFPIEVRRP